MNVIHHDEIRAPVSELFQGGQGRSASELADLSLCTLAFFCAGALLALATGLAMLSWYYLACLIALGAVGAGLCGYAFVPVKPRAFSIDSHIDIEG